MTQSAVLPAHVPSVWPGMAPGRQYLRLLTDDARLLAEHALPTPDDDEQVALQIAAEDQRIAFDYLRHNPSAVIFRLVYDGDDGRCVDITILASSDVRAHDKGQASDEE